MPDLKISQLPVAATPLSGAELVPIVQGGITEQTTVDAIMTSTVPSGTANGLLFLNGSKVATSGSSLTFDGASLTVGASAGAGQHILRTYTNAPGFAAIYNGGVTPGGSNYSFITTATQTTLNATTFVSTELGATEQMRLTSTGLGVGTSSPGVRLDVNGSARAYSNAYAGQVLFGSGNQWYLEASGTSNATAKFSLVGWNGSGYQTMWTSDSSGNLGIGTSSPTQKLDVVGNANVSGFIAINSAGGGIYDNLQQNVFYQTPNGTAFIWRDGASGYAERMRLDSSGNLGIGTSSPGAKLSVDSGATQEYANFNSTAAAGGFLTLTRSGANSIIIGNYAAASGGGSTINADALFFRTPNGIGFGPGGASVTAFMDASGNLGIGTSSPSFKLDVSGAINLQGSSTFPTTGVFLRSADNELKVIGGSAGIAFAAASGASTYATINSSGNLGLGVTPSASWSGQSALQVNTSSAFAGSSNFTSVATNAIATSTGWTANYLANGTAALYTQSVSTGAHAWFTAPSGTAGNAISFTQAMTLDASGNLTLGQTSSALQSGGTGITLYGSSASELKFLNSTTGQSATDGTALVTSGSNFVINNREAGAITFATSNTERARITSTGSFVAGGSVALATTATDGFLYVPTCAGTPTGVPTAITGMAPIMVDTTNNKMYFYSGGAWRDAGP